MRQESTEKKVEDRARIYRKWFRKKNPWLSSYYSAKYRCENPNATAYPKYGGKGIKFLMTKDDFKMLWKRDSAEKLLRPTIDRINSAGNYRIENCRYIELKENASFGGLKGGRSKSKLKQKAARENGKLGGRLGGRLTGAKRLPNGRFTYED